MRTPENCSTMAELRSAIDALDEKLIELLATRAGYIDRAAQLKTENGWPAKIPERVAEVIGNAKSRARAVGLDAKLAEQLWQPLVEWSIAREEQVLGPDAAREFGE